MQLASDSDRFIRLNAKGRKYEVLLECLDLVPASRLAKLKQAIQSQDVNELSRLCDSFSPDLTEFYFNLDPDIFSLILKFYESNSRVHLDVNKNGCVRELERQLNKFGINYEFYLDVCCLKKLDRERDKLEEELENERKILKDYLRRENFGYCFPKTRETIWNIMENPRTSKCAMIYNIFSALMVVISIVDLIIRSFPEYNTSFKKEEPFERNALVLIEVILIFWFTIEIIIRFIVAPNHLKFFWNFFTICDIVSVIPFYVFIFFWSSPTADFFKNICKILRIFRLIELFKLSNSLNTMLITTQKSFKEIFIFLIYLGMGVLIFSSIVFYCENMDGPSSGFVSIPGSFWWGIITMTTVGYGDIVPYTIAGRIFAGITAASGIIIVAIPISLLTTSFSDAYNQNKEKEKVIKNYKNRQEKLKMLENMIELKPTSVGDIRAQLDTENYFVERF